MVRIKPLLALDAGDLQRLIQGYVSDGRYQVSKTEGDGRFALVLELVPLPQPLRKRFDPPDAATLARYRQIATQGYTFGAYDGGQCVGLALAEPDAWNGSLWVWELHVAETHRRRGIGRQLLDAVAAQATATGLRVVVCETQNTNLPAIRFYRRNGHQIDGLDLSHYTNDDYPDGEIAIFMKKHLRPPG